MQTAVISDIHGNAEAFKRVLEAIDRAGIERIISLGDIIGYGPDPMECLDLVRERCEWSLMGNHDFGVLYEPTNFNDVAEQAAYWTREQLDNEPDEAKRAERYDYLGRLRVRVADSVPGCGASVLAVHGSPRRPINEYVFSEDVQQAPEKLESIFERIDQLCICGHTHVPGVFTDEPDFYAPSELGEKPVYTFSEGEKAIINVGSVGQPRDLDPRASYAVFDEGRVEFCRVEYDASVTAERIRAVEQLHDYLADRILKGQ